MRRQVKIIPEILNIYRRQLRVVIYQRTEDVCELSEEIKNEHTQINTIGMSSDAFLEKDIICHEQRDKDRCYIELYVINHVYFPQGPRYTRIA
jgi:hypothetical protein